MTLPSFDTKIEQLSNFTMQYIIPSDRRIAIDKSFEVSTSQSMPLGTHTCMGEPSEQAKAMPTCALVN
jgi:hypothetical protein